MAKAQLTAEQEKRAVSLAYAIKQHIESAFGKDYNPSAKVSCHEKRIGRPGLCCQLASGIRRKNFDHPSNSNFVYS